MSNFLKCNWKLLSEQKLTLVDLSMNNKTLTPEQVEHLDGLVNFLDALQDEMELGD